MSRKNKISYEEKMAAVINYKNGKGSYEMIAKTSGVDYTTVRRWVANYESMGEESLLPKAANKRYSKETKMQAVSNYLSGNGSLKDICKRYKILSNCQLRNWLRLYNGHKEFREVGCNGGIYMTKGKKTTLEERIEIAAYCIENGKDYAKTIEKYQVSYNQIYSWVRKYEQGGAETLFDRRGKAKPEEIMTEVDRLKAENKMLAAKLRDSEMENKLLKKLKEIERSGR